MFSALRSRRAVFWYLASDRIVAAVISRAEREPLLESCAASYSSPVPGGCFAPGVIEVAWVLGCEHLVHVAALSSAFCRLEASDDDAAVVPAPQRSRSEPDERIGTVRGAEGLRARADDGAVAQAAALFRRARLRLLALDCEACALASLADALGCADAEAARRQHLAAVALLPEAGGAAEALGNDLAVPVGLSLAWFGGRRAQ